MPQLTEKDVKKEHGCGIILSYEDLIMCGSIMPTNWVYFCGKCEKKFKKFKKVQNG